MKALVMYYSYEGNTEFIAEAISETLNVPIIRIHPTKDMTSTGFGKYVWGGGQVVMGIKPKIEPLDCNLDDYDVIFLGSPIWAGTYTPPIKTLLEDKFLIDKKVFYFYTHQGGAQNAERHAEKLISKSNQFVCALGFLDVLKNPDENRRKAQLWTVECAEEIK